LLREQEQRLLHEQEQRLLHEQERRRSEATRAQSEGLATRVFDRGSNPSPSNIEVPRDNPPPATISSLHALPSNVDPVESPSAAPPRAERLGTGIPSNPGEPAHTEPTQRLDTLQDFTLQTIERQLATFIGPLAKIMVRRAASKAANSDELYAILAATLERDADRLAFLSSKAGLTHGRAQGQPRIEPAQSTAQGTTAQGAPLTSSYSLELTPAVIDQAARLLAPYVGPISAVLVRKAAKRADNLRALYLLLAEHVEAGARRVRFLRDAGFPDA
jgi:hypothetical protein